MAVLFHVHCRGITMDVYSRNFTFNLMVVDEHLGGRRWKIDAAFPILARTPGSE